MVASVTSDSLQRRELLRQACTEAESILKEILEKAEHRANGAVTLALAVQSPLRPQLVSESNSILFYRLKRSACLLGVTTGSGFIISRCERVRSQPGAIARRGALHDLHARLTAHACCRGCPAGCPARTPRSSTGPRPVSSPSG